MFTETKLESIKSRIKQALKRLGIGTVFHYVGINSDFEPPTAYCLRDEKLLYVETLAPTEEQAWKELKLHPHLNYLNENELFSTKIVLAEVENPIPRRVKNLKQ